MPGNHLYNFHHATEMEVHDCPKCGMPYAAPAYFFERINEGQEGRQWYCPRGHPIVFGETEAERLKKQLDAARRGAQFAQKSAERARKERDHAKAQARGYKGSLTRTKNRIKAGVCPCCNRHFQNLQRHMDHKHPEYADSKEKTK